jgi:hypothetical protein
MSNPISALIASLSSRFGRKQAGASPDSEPTETSDGAIANAVRKPTSSYSKLQSMTPESAGPAFNRPASQEQMWQASRGGADATKEPRRASSTFTKLQALSASGNGKSASEKPIAQNGNLNNLLDDLQKD